MSGVPYSPIVPSFTMWQSGACRMTAQMTLNVAFKLFWSVKRASSKPRIEYGPDGCSA